MRKTPPKDVRVIHIRLSPDLHRRLRIRAAEEDKTIQEWVSNVIARALNLGRRHRRRS